MTLIVLAGVVILTSLGLFIRYASLARKFKAYEEELTDLRRLAQDENKFEIPDLRIVIKLKDPLGLARRESNLAKLAASPAPHIVKRKCYEQVVAETLENFAERRIDVEVTLEAV